jgi:hypothetical protein
LDRKQHEEETTDACHNEGEDKREEAVEMRNGKAVLSARPGSGI